jgi:hypothetical protein
LGVLSVASSAHLLAGSLCETNAEHSEEVSVEGLGLHEGLNGGVPLLDDGAQLVSGDVHAVEVSVAIEALHFFDLDLHLSPGLLIAISVEVSQRYLKHSALQTVSSDLYTSGVSKGTEILTLTSGSVARSDGWGSHIEHSWDVNIVPFLLGERMGARNQSKTSTERERGLTSSSSGPSF